MTEQTNSYIEDDEVIQMDSDVAILIGLSRIYDLMLVIAQKVNPEDAEQMLRLHSGGKLYGPPPFWGDYTTNE